MGEAPPDLKERRGEPTMADNIIIGSGRLYVADLGADDAPGPERYLGDSTGASVSGGEGENLTVFAGDGADRSRRLVDVLTDVSRSMSLTLHDLSFENIALFVTGDAKVSGAVAAVAEATPEQFPACKAGDEFQLGTYVAAAPALGYPSVQTPTSATRNIKMKAGDSGGADDATKVRFVPVMADYVADGDSASNTTDGAAGSTPGADVVVFGDTGRVRALKDFDSGFRLSYTPVAAFDYVESATRTIEAAVRYVEYDPQVGVGRSVYIDKARISANGEWPLKARDSEQTLGLTCEILGKLYVGAGATAAS